ncbi:MAG: DUF2156 domain-containing protein [Kiritimatiellae bacterium]|nr:DUF2156 domain-containing protein [Kiritimatiellia bacterium]
MTMPQGYRLLTPQDAHMVREWTACQGNFLPDAYAPGNIIAWGSRYAPAFRADGSSFWMFSARSGSLFFPLRRGGPPPSPAEVRREAEAIAAQCGEPAIHCVPVEWAEANRSALEDWRRVEVSRDFQDYVYAAADLAELPGAKYGAKRNLIHQFEREHPGWRVEPLSAEPMKCARMQAFIEEWRMTADDTAGSLDGDLEALATAFRHWGLGVYGGLALYADDAARGPGALLAFSVFSIPTDDMADTHFEKAVRDVKGAYQLINRETARLLRARGISWIDREEDMGVPGLRRAKESYHPAMLMPVCSLVPRA